MRLEITEVDYECASCHGVFTVPITHFDGFVETIRIAANMGRNGKHFDINKVPTVNACCPDCFQKVNVATKGK